MKNTLARGALLGLTAGIVATFFDSLYMLVPDAYVPTLYPVLVLLTNVLFWTAFGCVAGVCVHVFFSRKTADSARQQLRWLVFFLLPFAVLYGILGKLDSKQVVHPGFDTNLVFLLVAVFIAGVLLLRKKYPASGFGTGFLIPEIVVVATLFHLCSNIDKSQVVQQSFVFVFSVDFFADPQRFIELLKMYTAVLYVAGVALLIGIYFIIAVKVNILVSRPLVSLAVIFLITTVVLVACFRVSRGAFLEQYNQFAGMQSRESHERYPPVFLIVLDTLRKRSFDEHPDIYRNLTAFSRESLVFERCIANSSWTLPSHASLFTGLNIHEHGADFSADGPRMFDRIQMRPLSDAFITLADIFTDNGYFTAAITANFGPMNPATGLSKGFQMYDWAKSIGILFDSFAFKPLLHPVSFVTNTNNKFAVPYRKAEDVNDAVFHFLRRVPSGPFFLFVNYMDPHDPYLPSQPYKRFFIDPGSLYGHPIFKAVGVYFNRISEKYHCAVAEMLYKGDIAYLDHQIGVLFQGLKDAGLYDEALIVITSDHGHLFCEQGYSGHKTPLYEGVTRVPLLIKFPHQQVTGTEEQYITLADLYPTILTVCGLPYPDSISGKAFGKPPGPVVAEFYSYDVGEHRAVYDGNYKYMKFERGKPDALYDLSADPLEKNNIIDDVPEKAAAMELYLADWLISHPPLYTDEGLEQMQLAPIRMRDDLRSLGYIE